MNRTGIKVIFSELVRVATLPFRLLPVKKNRILFTGLTGGHVYDYSCNPKYIYEYLRDYAKGQYEFVWAVSDKEKYRFLQEEGVKLVRHFTLSSIPMLLTAKVIVTNGSYVPWFPFRKKQCVINTWHGGGAYKKVEMETDKTDWAAKRMTSFCANNMDLFVASCRVQEEQMIRTTYGYQGEVLRKGTPRNDRLVNHDTEQMARKVREVCQIPADAKILLYAPTYRYGTVPAILDCDSLLEQLGGKWVFLNRYHRYQTEDMNVRVVGTKMIDVMDYPDMQELLAAADVLVTDYSSCVWDYSFLKRPCILFVPDKEEYIRKTGFYVEPDQWPFPQAASQQELCSLIQALEENAVRKEEYIKDIERHLQELGSYESGQATEAIAVWIKKRMEEC